MPIYEYACTACDHRTDILHGLNDPGPAFCPSCGEEGTMRKLFAPPTIHYKGSGWAKKDRGASGAKKAATPKADADAAATPAKTDGSSTKSDATSTSSGPAASGD